MPLVQGGYEKNGAPPDLPRVHPMYPAAALKADIQLAVGTHTNDGLHVCGLFTQAIKNPVQMKKATARQVGTPSL